MAKELKVLVACGSGIVTSTIAQEAIKAIAAENNIPVHIYKSTIQEVQDKQKDVDVVFITANYRNKLEKPYLSVFGIVSSIGKAQNEKKVAELLKEVYAKLN